MTAPSPTASLLDRTLAAATRDTQMVTPAGQRIGRLIDGVTIRPLPTHSDARGSIVELFDSRWSWHPDPVVFTYCFTIRPGS